MLHVWGGGFIIVESNAKKKFGTTPTSIVYNAGVECLSSQVFLISTGLEH